MVVQSVAEVGTSDHLHSNPLNNLVYRMIGNLFGISLTLSNMIQFLSVLGDAPVKYQLATFLCCVGSDSAVKTAAIMSIAEGLVYKYMGWVCKALWHIHNDHLAWPGALRCAYISNAMQQSGFPGCLGSADGTYI
jgi:hypothetical protein